MYRSGKAKYENGGVYDGDFQNDMRDGWGSHCFPDESMYVGEWAQDKVAGDSLHNTLFASRSTRQDCLLSHKNTLVQVLICKPGRHQEFTSMVSSTSESKLTSDTQPHMLSKACTWGSDSVNRIKLQSSLDVQLAD